MMSTTDTSVRTSVVVNVGPERAFAAFTDEMLDWWNPDHHLLESRTVRMVVEPRVGGGLIDHGEDGSQCRWGDVLAWEPPRRFVFSWNISPRWTIEPDPERRSEVEVTFSADGAERTRVELCHRHLERHGEGWEQVRTSIASDDGWPSGLSRFAEYLGG
jgi:uncharacterized protein YndB with AHSA1/START domain